MIENFLIPQNSVLKAKGEGQPIEVSGAANRVFLMTLQINRVVEQESVDISIYGSPDGTTWDVKPYATFPQRFYVGETPVLLDLTDQGNVKFVRAQWDVNRWGRGSEEPMFDLSLSLREIPQEVLAEVRKEAATRK